MDQYLYPPPTTHLRPTFPVTRDMFSLERVRGTVQSLVPGQILKWNADVRLYITPSLCCKTLCIFCDIVMPFVCTIVH